MDGWRNHGCGYLFYYVKKESPGSKLRNSQHCLIEFELISNVKSTPLFLINFNSFKYNYAINTWLIRRGKKQDLLLLPSGKRKSLFSSVWRYGVQASAFACFQIFWPLKLFCTVLSSAVWITQQDTLFLITSPAQMLLMQWETSFFFQHTLERSSVLACSMSAQCRVNCLEGDGRVLVWWLRDTH